MSKIQFYINKLKLLLNIIIRGINFIFLSLEKFINKLISNNFVPVTKKLIKNIKIGISNINSYIINFKLLLIYIIQKIIKTASKLIKFFKNTIKFNLQKQLKFIIKDKIKILKLFVLNKINIFNTINMYKQLNNLINIVQIVNIFKKINNNKINYYKTVISSYIKLQKKININKKQFFFIITIVILLIINYYIFYYKLLNCKNIFLNNINYLNIFIIFSIISVYLVLIQSLLLLANIFIPITKINLFYIKKYNLYV